MLKKLFVTAAAAAAVSVPLAGVAWAEPSSDNNPPGQGPTGPGVPRQAGAYLDSVDANGPEEPDVNPNGYGNPLSAGATLKTRPKTRSQASARPMPSGRSWMAFTWPLRGS